MAKLPKHRVYALDMIGGELGKELLQDGLEGSCRICARKKISGKKEDQQGPEENWKPISQKLSGAANPGAGHS
jgi:hypothetical protein